MSGEELGWVQADLGEARRERDKARDDAAELRTAAEECLEAQEYLRQQPTYYVAHVRLQSAANRLRAALAATEGRGEP